MPSARSPGARYRARRRFNPKAHIHAYGTLAPRGYSAPEGSKLVGGPPGLERAVGISGTQGLERQQEFRVSSGLQAAGAPVQLQAFQGPPPRRSETSQGLQECMGPQAFPSLQVPHGIQVPPGLHPPQGADTSHGLQAFQSLQPSLFQRGGSTGTWSCSNCPIKTFSFNAQANFCPGCGLRMLHFQPSTSEEIAKLEGDYFEREFDIMDPSRVAPWNQPLPDYFKVIPHPTGRSRFVVQPLWLQTPSVQQQNTTTGNRKDSTYSSQRPSEGDFSLGALSSSTNQLQQPSYSAGNPPNLIGVSLTAQLQTEQFLTDLSQEFPHLSVMSPLETDLFFAGSSQNHPENSPASVPSVQGRPQIPGTVSCAIRGGFFRTADARDKDKQLSKRKRRSSSGAPLQDPIGSSSAKHSLVNATAEALPEPTVSVDDVNECDEDSYGIFKCGVCGKTFRGEWAQNTRNQHERYYCPPNRLPSAGSSDGALDNSLVDDCSTCSAQADKSRNEMSRCMLCRAHFHGKRHNYNRTLHERRCRAVPATGRTASTTQLSAQAPRETLPQPTDSVDESSKRLIKCTFCDRYFRGDAASYFRDRHENFICQMRHRPSAGVHVPGNTLPQPLVSVDENGKQRAKCTFCDKVFTGTSLVSDRNYHEERYCPLGVRPATSSSIDPLKDPSTDTSSVPVEASGNRTAKCKLCGKTFFGIKAGYNTKIHEKRRCPLRFHPSAGSSEGVLDDLSADKSSVQASREITLRIQQPKTSISVPTIDHASPDQDVPNSFGDQITTPVQPIPLNSGVLPKITSSVPQVEASPSIITSARVTPGQDSTIRATCDPIASSQNETPRTANEPGATSQSGLLQNGSQLANFSPPFDFVSLRDIWLTNDMNGSRLGDFGTGKALLEDMEMQSTIPGNSLPEFEALPEDMEIRSPILGNSLPEPEAVPEDMEIQSPVFGNSFPEPEAVPEVTEMQTTIPGNSLSEPEAIPQTSNLKVLFGSSPLERETVSQGPQITQAEASPSHGEWNPVQAAGSGSSPPGHQPMPQGPLETIEFRSSPPEIAVSLYGRSSLPQSWQTQHVQTRATSHNSSPLLEIRSSPPEIALPHGVQLYQQQGAERQHVSTDIRTQTIAPGALSFDTPPLPEQGWNQLSDTQSQSMHPQHTQQGWERLRSIYPSTTRTQFTGGQSERLQHGLSQPQYTQGNREQQRGFAPQSSPTLPTGAHSERLQNDLSQSTQPQHMQWSWEQQPGYPQKAKISLTMEQQEWLRNELAQMNQSHYTHGNRDQLRSVHPSQSDQLQNGLSQSIQPQYTQGTWQQLPSVHPQNIQTFCVGEQRGWPQNWISQSTQPQYMQGNWEQLPSVYPQNTQNQITGQQWEHSQNWSLQTPQNQYLHQQQQWPQLQYTQRPLENMTDARMTDATRMEQASNPQFGSIFGRAEAERYFQGDLSHRMNLDMNWEREPESARRTGHENEMGLRGGHVMRGPEKARLRGGYWEPQSTPARSTNSREALRGQSRMLQRRQVRSPSPVDSEVSMQTDEEDCELDPSNSPQLLSIEPEGTNRVRSQRFMLHWWVKEVMVDEERMDKSKLQPRSKRLYQTRTGSEHDKNWQSSSPEARIDSMEKERQCLAELEEKRRRNYQWDLSSDLREGHHSHPAMQQYYSSPESLRSAPVQVEKADWKSGMPILPNPLQLHWAEPHDTQHVQQDVDELSLPEILTLDGYSSPHDGETDHTSTPGTPHLSRFRTPDPYPIHRSPSQRSPSLSLSHQPSTPSPSSQHPPPPTPQTWQHHHQCHHQPPNLWPIPTLRNSQVLRPHVCLTDKQALQLLLARRAGRLQGLEMRRRLEGLKRREEMKRREKKWVWRWKKVGWRTVRLDDDEMEGRRGFVPRMATPLRNVAFAEEEIDRGSDGDEGGYVGESERSVLEECEGESEGGGFVGDALEEKGM